jgi:dTDP-4-dehydrorhamnose 3,5-epimerase-like enzyme
LSKKEAEMYCSASVFYATESATGVHYNDSDSGIEWAREVTVMSDNNKILPDFSG